MNSMAVLRRDLVSSPENDATTPRILEHESKWFHQDGLFKKVKMSCDSYQTVNAGSEAAQSYEESLDQLLKHTAWLTMP